MNTISIGPISYHLSQIGGNISRFSKPRESIRHHSRSAITQLAAGFYYFFLFFFLHLGETLSRMGSSTIFQRSYSKTRTFSNFRSSRFIPHPPSLLLVLAIEIKSASITTVPLLKNDEVTLLFFLFFFCFLFFVFCFFSIPPHNKSASGIFIGTAFETVTRFRD